MNLATTHRRERLADLIRQLAEGCGDEVKAICNAWLENKDDAEGSRKAAPAVVKMAEEWHELRLSSATRSARRSMTSATCSLRRASGSSAATAGHTISAYGGLDHVLASGRRRQRPRTGHRSLLQHRRTVLQGHSDRLPLQSLPLQARRTKKKDLGMMRHELRLRLRCTGLHGRRSRTRLLKAIGRSRSLSRPVPHHCLRSLHQPRHQGRHEQGSGRSEEGC